MLNISSAFAVPFADILLDGSERLNTDLVKEILRLESFGAEHRNPSPLVPQPDGLFESRFDFFANPDPSVQSLRRSVWHALGELVRAVNSAPEAAPERLDIRSHTWFHVTRSGGHFGYHNHPMASWSGVYCVSDGEPDPTVRDNGCLVFPTPLAAANSYVDVANASLRWPFNHGNLVITPKPGQLVLFPSWLGHYVTPFRGRRERITVAFNAWFSVKGPG